jgi:mannose-6-phosphate isomerase-like protein (cupin superfamily)
MVIQTFLRDNETARWTSWPVARGHDTTREEETNMEASGSDNPRVSVGAGYAVAHLDDLGDGPGFRKVRKGLGVTAFGVNAIVMPPGIETGAHYHDEQEELYFVHRGAIEMQFGDGSIQKLGEGGLARVDAATVRSIRNAGDGDAVYLIAGGKDGYIGRDGRVPEGEEQRVRVIHDLSAPEQPA